MADSRNLENISRDHDSQHGSGDERRRMARLCLTGELFRYSPTGKTFLVTDLSPQGMALRMIDREDLRLYPVGMQVKGEINLRREKYQINARVRNIRGDIVGFQFEELSKEVTDVLSRYLDPVSLGQELKPLPSSDATHGTGTLWYHGPSGTDLLLWRGMDGQYRRMALYVQGSFVQWETDHGVATGFFMQADERPEVRGVLRFETLMLNMDAHPDLKKLTVAKTILMNSILPQDLIKWCTRQLTLEV
jgi:hypothetical protein